MESDEELSQGTPQPLVVSQTKAGPPVHRVWSERFVQPVKFRRFTGPGFTGKSQIYFQFDLPPGQDRLDPGVYELMKELQYLTRSLEHGGGLCPTGLRVVSNGRQKPGTLWQLADTHSGRVAADILQVRLRELADELKSESSQSR